MAKEKNCIVVSREGYINKNKKKIKKENNNNNN